MRNPQLAYISMLDHSIESALFLRHGRCVEGAGLFSLTIARAFEREIFTERKEKSENDRMREVSSVPGPRLRRALVLEIPDSIRCSFRSA